MNRYPSLRYLAQFLVIGLPLFTGGFSLYDWLGYQPNAAGEVTVEVAGFAFTAKKALLDFQTRVAISFALLAIALINEFATAGLPLKRMREFRKHYLDELYTNTIKGLLGDGFRINLMYARRSPWFLFIPRFEWAWSQNYKPPIHRDFGMALWTWQGVAGLAYRGQQAKSAYFCDTGHPPALGGPYLMFPWQLSKTNEIQGILSVPVLRRQPSGKHVAVGVLNVDAMTSAAVESLRKNEVSLAQYFTEIGILLGDLSL